MAWHLPGIRRSPVFEDGVLVTFLLSGTTGTHISKAEQAKNRQWLALLLVLPCKGDPSHTPATQKLAQFKLPPLS